jgi:hypothetical protein
LTRKLESVWATGQTIERVTIWVGFICTMTAHGHPIGARLMVSEVNSYALIQKDLGHIITLVLMGTPQKRHYRAYMIGVLKTDISMSVVTNLASWLYYEYHDEYDGDKKEDEDDNKRGERT